MGRLGVVQYFRLAACVWITFTGSPVWGASSFIKLPCSASGKGLLRSCKTLGGQVQANLTKIVDQKLSCFYQQLDTDLSKGNEGNPSCTVSANPFETPCNLALGEVSTPNPAMHANFSSCGAPAVLSGGMLWAGGTVGTLERSYFHGAYLQSLRSCRAAVLKEIQVKNGFNGGSCGAAVVADYGSANSAMNTAGARLDELQGMTESSQVDAYCNGEGPKLTSTPEQAKHRTVVCHLSAARSAIESMVNRMAECEIFARWSRVWPANYAKLNLGLQDNVSGYCNNWAINNSPTHSYGICPACVTSQNPDEVTASFNRCYQKTLPIAFKALVLQLFPEDGSTCAVGGS